MKFFDQMRIKRLFTVQRGNALCVLRPRDPELALRLTDNILAKQKDGSWSAERVTAEFQKIITVQEYQFLGFMGAYKGQLTRIVDGDGKIVGTMERGDSFISAEWQGSGKTLRPVPPYFVMAAEAIRETDKASLKNIENAMFSAQGVSQ